MRRIEKRGVVNVLCDDDGNGCMPATRAEVEFFDELTRLRAEVESLKATLTQQCKGFRADVENLEAEVEALRADAERYRWLRDGSNPPWVMQMLERYADNGSDFDAEVDAARAPQQAEPVAWVPVHPKHGRLWANTVPSLDNDRPQHYPVDPLFLRPPPAPQQAEPVAQIGWADEFGNLFPMGAWKPAQSTHHDSHKTAWRPVFLRPPAAEVQQAEPVGDFQRSAPGKIWMNLGNDGMDEIEYPTWDALVRADENITWSEDRIDATDIPYVRADLAHPPAAEVQRLKDAARALCGALTASELTDRAYHALNALHRALEGGE